MNQLTVTFPGRILGPLSLEMSHGIAQLVGGNGSGKTSLLRAIASAIPRSGGVVRIAGRDPELDPRARAQIGFVPARPEMPGFLTVREAWSFMADLRRANWDGRALEERFGLPPDLPMSHGSTGQRRKAEIIAALAGDPPVVIFDETLANIDPESRDYLTTWIEQNRQDRVILITHHGTLAIEPDIAVEV